MLEEERPEEQENSDPAVNTHVRTGNQCQVDTSWVYEGRGTGLGFVSWEGGNRSIMGLKNCRQTASPLHAEAEGLRRAMKRTLEEGYHTMHFETYCVQLWKLI